MSIASLWHSFLGWELKRWGPLFKWAKISAPLKGNIHVDTCSRLVIIFGVSLVLDRIFSSQCRTNIFFGGLEVEVSSGRHLEDQPSKWLVKGITSAIYN